MKSLASWLFTIFAIMFWIFRVMVAVADSTGGSMGVSIPNNTVEIVLLFTTLVCIVLIVKRVRLAGLVYFASYAIYFGQGMIKDLIQLIKGEALGLQAYTDMFVSLIAITLGFLILADLVLNKHRANKLGDKKTDWFFQGEEYDRKFDERADRNEYRT